MLSNIRIVLVNTSHPGNIGSAARAMKTMGLNHLYLVAPQFFPHAKAIEMASGAVDVLEKAVVVNTVEEAIADCSLVAGTSARVRTIPWPLVTGRQFASHAIQEAVNKNVAIIFGREQSGLTNEELQRCHFQIQIPTHPDYSSLNLAASVQVVAYELRIASLSATEMLFEEWDYPFATAKEMTGFYEHLQKVLIDIKFLNPAAPRKLMTRLRRLFQRARPDVMDINILRGILGAVEKLLL